MQRDTISKMRSSKALPKLGILTVCGGGFFPSQGGKRHYVMGSQVRRQMQVCDWALGRCEADKSAPAHGHWREVPPTKKRTIMMPRIDETRTRNQQIDHGVYLSSRTTAASLGARGSGRAPVTVMRMPSSSSSWPGRIWAPMRPFKDRPCSSVGQTWLP